MKLDWEDEVKLLLSGNWRPSLRGGFSLVCPTRRGEWILWPPQGVYVQWTGRFTPMRGRSSVVHADTATAALELLKGIESTSDGPGGPSIFFDRNEDNAERRKRT